MSCSSRMLHTPQMRRESLHPGRRLHFGTPIWTFPCFSEELGCRSTILHRDIPYPQHPHLISQIRDRPPLGFVVPPATALIFVQPPLDLQRVVGFPHFSTGSAAVPAALDECVNVVHNQAEEDDERPEEEDEGER